MKDIFTMAWRGGGGCRYQRDEAEGADAKGDGESELPTKSLDTITPHLWGKIHSTPLRILRAPALGLLSLPDHSGMSPTLPC